MFAKSTRSFVDLHAKADRDVNVTMSNLQLFLLGRQQPSD